MQPPGDRPRVVAARRDLDQHTVTPLELFFDLVFVLAITQCTSLMAADPTWPGLARGLLVLVVLWWSWVGYSWLTSVVDPEHGPVRLVMFGAMAGVLVAALCVPEVFDDRGLLFAGAYAAVRTAHIALFTLASRDDPGLRRSVSGLAVSTGMGVGLLIAAAFTDGTVQGGLWVLAVTLDLLGPLLFGADGWSLVPEHFAERHGLILLIALGESIVAIGLAVDTTVDTAEVVASVLGVVVAAALWWLYFDVVALVAAHHLAAAPPGRVQNSMARDSYSYLHLPMVAGIVLIALGLKKVIGHVGDPLHTVPAAALLGGTAMYLLGHVAFRLRNVRTLNRQRTLVALVCLAGIPVAAHRPGLAVLTALTCVLVLLLVYEVVRFGEARARMRRELRHL